MSASFWDYSNFNAWLNNPSLPHEELTELDLGGSQLTILPPEIGNLPTLEELDLQDNQLTILPPEIGQLSFLYTLNLENNQLTALPPQIGNLINLDNLYLANNQLTALPPQIGNLTNLRRLGLENNQLTNLPSQIGNLIRLKVINLNNNQLTTLTPYIGNLIHLEVINLNNNQLTTLPPHIGNITGLRILNAKNNQLTALPPQIGNLRRLEVINLNNNQLTALPPHIGNLTDLEELDLGYNQLTALPAEIESLTSLGTLNLGHNQLTALPPEIESLTSLAYLNLGHNQLTTLPPEIGNLTSLEELYLNDNQITSLPPEMSNLTSLEELDLINNLMPILPPEILNMNIMDLVWEPSGTQPNLIPILQTNPYSVHQFFELSLANHATLIPLLSLSGVSSTETDAFFSGNTFSDNAGNLFYQFYNQTNSALIPGLTSVFNHASSLNLNSHMKTINGDIIPVSAKDFIVASLKFGYNRTQSYKDNYVSFFMEESLNAYPEYPEGDINRISCPKGIMERLITNIPKALKIDGDTSLEQEVNAQYSKAQLEQICELILGPSEAEADLTALAINNLYASGCASTDAFDEAPTSDAKKVIFKQCILDEYVRNGGIDNASNRAVIDAFIANPNYASIFEVYEGGARKRTKGKQKYKTSKRKFKRSKAIQKTMKRKFKKSKTQKIKNKGGKQKQKQKQKQITLKKLKRAKNQNI